MWSNALPRSNMSFTTIEQMKRKGTKREQQKKKQHPIDLADTKQSRDKYY